MDGSQLYLLIVTILCLYCTGASWLLQFVCYPTYLLVGEKEFVPFHVSFGRRLMVAVVPMGITCIGMIALLFARPDNVPVWAALLAVACAVVILGTTVVLEVPKHMKLDREGKSDALINGLVRDNLPRTIGWTLASITLAYMVTLQFV
jgi:hypothetical protein